MPKPLAVGSLPVLAGIPVNVAAPADTSQSPHSPISWNAAKFYGLYFHLKLQQITWYPPPGYEIQCEQHEAARHHQTAMVSQPT